MTTINACAIGCETYADFLARVLRAGLIEELVRGRVRTVA